MLYLCHKYIWIVINTDVCFTTYMSISPHLPSHNIQHHFIVCVASYLFLLPSHPSYCIEVMCLPLGLLIKIHVSYVSLTLFSSISHFVYV